MAFESLSEKLQGVFKNLRSKGRLTEDDVKAAMREVKRALLEADVNFQSCKDIYQICTGKSRRTGCIKWFESGTDGNQDRKTRDGSINGINDDRDPASSR